MRRYLCLLAVIIASVVTTITAGAQEATPDACPTLSRDETAEVARQYLDVWNTKDLNQFDDYANHDVVHHWGQGVDTIGLEDLKASTDAFFVAFPDVEMTFDDVIVEGNMVVIRWTLTGTQTGPFFGIEPTGNAAEWTGINIYRIECGKVAESWGEADGVGLRQQILPQDPYATPGS